MNIEKLKELKVGLLQEMIDEDKKNNNDWKRSFQLLIIIVPLFFIMLFLGMSVSNDVSKLFFYFISFFSAMLSICFLFNKQEKFKTDLVFNLSSFDHLSKPLCLQNDSFKEYFEDIMKETIFDNNKITYIFKEIKQSVSVNTFEQVLFNKETLKNKEKYGVGSLYYVCHFIDQLMYGTIAEVDNSEIEKQDPQNKYILDKIR